MTQTAKLIDIPALKNAEVKQQPFPYFTSEASLLPAGVKKVIEAFPDIIQGGSFNIDDVQIQADFQDFLQDLDSPEFRQLLSDKLDIDLKDRPIMMTLRGYSRAKDGRMHTDSKTKLVTVLIYLNESWSADTGRLRILNGGSDMNDFVEEIAPGPGSLVAFKVTDNCWHGYPSYEGTRRSIQINFLSSDSAGSKHRFFHKLSAKLKALTK